MSERVVRPVGWLGWRSGREQGCWEGKNCEVLSLGWSAAGAACIRLRCQLAQGDHPEDHRGRHIVPVEVVDRLGMEIDLEGDPRGSKC